MSRFEFDWRYVLRNSLAPLVTLFVSAAILVAGVWMHDSQKNLFARFAVNQDVMHEDYDELVFRRRLVDQYHRRYQQFHDVGFVGLESRLDWIEALRTTSTDLVLPSVSYAIEPQLQVVAPVESILTEDDIQIRLSRLELEIGLVHELDLLHFFDELQSHAPGLIQVDRCNLASQSGENDELTAQANIRASCSIRIFSVITSDVSSEVPQI